MTAAPLLDCACDFQDATKLVFTCNLFYFPPRILASCTFACAHSSSSPSVAPLPSLLLHDGRVRDVRQGKAERHSISPPSARLSPSATPRPRQACLHCRQLEGDGVGVRCACVRARCLPRVCVCVVSPYLRPPVLASFSLPCALEPTRPVLHPCPYLCILFTLSQNHGDEAGARRGDVARAKDAVESTKSIEAVSHEITNLRGKNAITTLPVDLMTDVMQILQRWVSARIRTMGGGGGGRKGRGHNGGNAWGCGTSHP